MLKTREEILNELLLRIDAKYDKRVGTLVHDLLASFSIETEELRAKIKELELKFDINNLVGDEVDKYVSQNADMQRNSEKHSGTLLNVYGNGNVDIDDLFETKAGIQFAALESKLIVESGTVLVSAVLPGVSGNVIAGTIVQIPVTIPGITSVNNLTAASGGFDKEKDKAFIERFLSTQEEEVTQGNKAAYKAWCLDYDNIGNCKVFPLVDADGAAAENSTQIIVIDSDCLPASVQLVSDLQEHINPLGANGHGEGVAPMGAYAYIKAATPLVIDVSVSLTYKAGYTEEIVEPLLNVAINDYIKSIAFKETSVSHAKVGNAVFDAEGIDDHAALTINALSNNIAIPDKSVAVLGVITIV